MCLCSFNFLKTCNSKCCTVVLNFLKGDAHMGLLLGVIPSGRTGQYRYLNDAK